MHDDAELQVLKLPAGKYTVREREMMTGSGLVPAEFFHASSALSKTVVIGECLCKQAICVHCVHVCMIGCHNVSLVSCTVCEYHSCLWPASEAVVCVQLWLLVLPTHSGYGARSKSQTTIASKLGKLATECASTRYTFATSELKITTHVYRGCTVRHQNTMHVRWYVGHAYA